MASSYLSKEAFLTRPRRIKKQKELMPNKRVRESQKLAASEFCVLSPNLDRQPFEPNLIVVNRMYIQAIAAACGRPPLLSRGHACSMEFVASYGISMSTWS